jgi:opacity protein-like surface antigen
MRNLTVAAGALAAAILIGASVAAAATPQQIYRDYADNGRLDGHYSSADLKRAYRDAVVQGYGGPSGENLKPTIKKKLGDKNGQQSGQQSGQKSGEQGVSTPPVKSSGGLPFTGLDLALITIGGLLLLGFGAGLRRFARRTS